MGFYESHILPPFLDLACGTKPILRERREVVPQAKDEVLEVGFGTGLNLPYYDPARVTTVWGLEPSEAMRERADKRLRFSRVPFRFLGLNGEQIPAEDARFDTVLVTFTLCTIPQVERALDEMRRVLKPEGRLLFAEHGAAPDPGVRVWQDRLTPIWRRLAGGCHLNRDIAGLIRAAGFRIESSDADYRRGMPRFAGYITHGSAVPI